MLFSQLSPRLGLSRGAISQNHLGLSVCYGIQQLVRDHPDIVREEVVANVSYANVTDTFLVLMLKGGPSVKLRQYINYSPKRASSLLRDLQYRC